MQNNAKSQKHRSLALYFSWVLQNGHYGKLRFRTEDEQQLWADYSHLLSNCIICYNCRLLSACLEQLEQEGSQPALDQLVKLSPVTWQHVNFYGRYTFSKSPEAIHPEQLAAGLISEKLSGTVWL